MELNKQSFSYNNNSEFIGQIATYEINNYFTDCKVLKKQKHKMDKLE